MLNRRRDEMAPAGGIERLGGATDGEVVAFCPTAREDNLRRLGTDEGRHRAPGLVHGRFGPLSKWWTLDGLPKSSRSTFVIASTTSGWTGVVAL